MLILFSRPYLHRISRESTSARGALPVELSHDYLSRQLIAYIGNKRALLPYLARVFEELADGVENPVFLDPFCGSGSVSRLGKFLRFQVKANDWEQYARIVTECHVSVDEKDLKGLFSERNGIESVFSELNRLGSANIHPGYISDNYAPKSTERADYRYERLFYTRENALFIDCVRDMIEEWYPDESMEKTVLLSALLYQAGTHANTSGVFKAYHKGFGGHGRDALTRIMKPIRLEIPVLIDRPVSSRVYSSDAEDFVRGRTGLICYLDPPYNIHQYGSNYFMLNTIAQWDKPEVSMERTGDNRLKEKAGIRKDWTRTRSPFCSRRTAGAAFRRLLDRIDTRYICVSYNTEGIIPFEELCDSLAGEGRLTLESENYVKYRGGRQSISRNTHNIEFLLVLDRNRRTGTEDRKKIIRFSAIKRVQALQKRSFAPARIDETFDLEEGDLVLFKKNGMKMTSPILEKFHFPAVSSQNDFEMLGLKDLENLEEKLCYCQCRDRKEECSVLIDILKKGMPVSRRKKLQQFLLRAVRKFAHRKYTGDFYEIHGILTQLAETDPAHFGSMKSSLAEISRIARMRFSG